MKRAFLLLVVSTTLLGVAAFAQNPPPTDPGPFYFSNHRPGAHHRYWGGTNTYGGIRVVENYNLLAAVLGDEPSLGTGQLPAGSRLVSQEVFDFGGGSVTLQPFAYYQEKAKTRSNTRGLPIGPRLDAFLDDPLAGADFDLTLPFIDPGVALSDRSAVLRVSNEVPDTGDWHVAVDLDFSGNTSQGFLVLAPADGFIEGNGTTHTLCLSHTASNGREFLTIYAHMVPESKRFWQVGDRVMRGQVLGRVEGPGYTHLHFGIAVRGPTKRVNGVRVPELWYLIDPFGVYDYRRNRFSQTTYNYLPNNDLRRNVRGIRHAYAWRTNPPFESIPSILLR